MVELPSQTTSYGCLQSFHPIPEGQSGWCLSLILLPTVVDSWCIVTTRLHMVADKTADKTAD